MIGDRFDYVLPKTCAVLTRPRLRADAEPSRLPRHRRGRKRIEGAVRTKGGNISRAAKDGGSPGVYILKIEGRPVAKIGVSKNLAVRLDHISTSSPDRIVCAAWLECTTIGLARSVEKRLLGTMRRAGRHLRGEWITIDDAELPLVVRYAKAVQAEVLDKANAAE